MVKPVIFPIEGYPIVLIHSFGVVKATDGATCNLAMIGKFLF
jgi:hypothetical protein